MNFCGLMVLSILVVVMEVQVLAYAITKAFDFTLFSVTFVLGTWWRFAIPDVDLYTATTSLEDLV